MTQENLAVAAVAIFILFAVEGLLAHWGVGWYYRFGIPLFRSTFDVPVIPNLPPRALSDAYERFFNEPLVFVSISENAIGFHEKYYFFDYRPQLFKIKYAPVMRGLILIDRDARKVSVICRPNWSVLIFFGLFVGNFVLSGIEWMQWPIIAFILVPLLFTVWIQYARYSSVCWFLRDKKF